MKKQLKTAALCLCALLLIAGCGTTKPAAGEITLGTYKGLTIDKADVTVTDEELADNLHSIIDQYLLPEQITDRAVAEGDTVNIDYKGLLDGVAFEGGTDTGYDLIIGSGNFIEGFEEGLIGKMPGTQADLNLTFPESYHAAELAGKSVVFEVQINYIVGEGHIHPEINDAWAKENFDHDTLEEFEATLREEMIADKVAQAASIERDALIDKIIENSTFGALPQDRVDAQIQSQKDYYTSYGNMWGFDLAGFIAAVGMTEEEFNNTLTENAESYIKMMLVLEKVAEEEGITLTDEDKEAYAIDYGYENYAAILEEGYEPAEVDSSMLAEKTTDFLIENNTFA